MGKDLKNTEITLISESGEEITGILYQPPFIGEYLYVFTKGANRVRKYVGLVLDFNLDKQIIKTTNTTFKYIIHE